MSVRSVLGVFSQPKGTNPLRLQQEQRMITHCLALSRYRDSIVFDSLAAATIDDLRRALLKRAYCVVHFSRVNGLILPSLQCLFSESRCT